MTAPDPHRALVGDLHAEIRRLRLTIAALRAELGEAQRHLNPPIGGSEVTEGDRVSLVVAELNPGSPDSGPGSTLSPDRPENGYGGSAGFQSRTARIDPRFTSSGEPVTIVPGIVVSPSVLAQRHAAPVEDAGDDLDDDE